jgi:3-phenylpropionate/trans-cinnamate dioxygenase ferredoxin reductase subunit
LRIPDEHNFEWRLGERIEKLDLSSRSLHLQGGSAIGFDGLVIATGARPRRLPGTDLDGVFTLRTLEDAQTIRERVQAGARKVAIIGAGFIGSEAAASLRKLDCDVTVIEMDRFPLLRVMGPAVGEFCATLHRTHGVHLELGAKFAGMVGDKKVRGVRLEDGRVIDAEIAIVGVGVTPNIEWLRDSGVPLGDGVLCNAACAAGDGIVAAGDLARWEHPRYGSIRVEHWDNAIAQGEAAAETLLGDVKPFAMIPFFWSDQYECKLQLIGMPKATDELRIVEGSQDARKFTSVFHRDGQITAAFLVSSMHRILKYKQLVESGARLEAVES